MADSENVPVAAQMDAAAAARAQRHAGLAAFYHKLNEPQPPQVVRVGDQPLPKDHPLAPLNKYLGATFETAPPPRIF